MKELEQEVKYLRQRGPQAWKSDSPSHAQPPSPSRAGAASVKLEEDPGLEADEDEGEPASSSSMKKIHPPPAFTVANSMQTETEFYFSRGEEAKNFKPPELSFQQYTDILETINRLFVMLASYQWNDKTATFLVRSVDDMTSDEEDEEEAFARRPSLCWKQTTLKGSSQREVGIDSPTEGKSGSSSATGSCFPA